MVRGFRNMMPEVEYLLVHEDLDKHYIVFEKNSKEGLFPFLEFRIKAILFIFTLSLVITYNSANHHKLTLTQR